MGRFTIKSKHLKSIGFTDASHIAQVVQLLQINAPYQTTEEKCTLAEQLLKDPESLRTHPWLHTLAHKMIEQQGNKKEKRALTPKPFEIFGAEHIHPKAIEQMHQAMRSPAVLEGALMPDAHFGYGVPIGGVLKTKKEIIPYAVGVDIGCRMHLSIFEDPASVLESKHTHLLDALLKGTRFGQKQGHFEKVMEHEVLEHPLFDQYNLLKKVRGKAVQQIGSSGGGNHFVEWGYVDILEKNQFQDLEAGRYLALLSHSGSRGMGAAIAEHFHQLARKICPEAEELQTLSYLTLDSEEGHAYWECMNLADAYAKACHEQIHQRLSEAMGLEAIYCMDHPHNLAFMEKSAEGIAYLYHRKGASPAGKGVSGIIPGSLTEPAYIVRGMGHAASLNSASHGAGRIYSRAEAKELISSSEVKRYLEEHKVTLVGGGIDESPFVYKNIHKVMEAQRDLIRVEGLFYPKIARMSHE